MFTVHFKKLKNVSTKNIFLEPRQLWGQVATELDQSFSFYLNPTLGTDTCYKI